MDKNLTLNHAISILKQLENLQQPDKDYEEFYKAVEYINSVEFGLITEKDGFYKLSRKIAWLDRDKINCLLQSNYKNYTIYIHEVLDSTNTFALNNHLSTKSVVTTELQCNGRGRSSRKWQSSIASDITLSIVYEIQTPSITRLSIITAVAMLRVFKLHYLNVLLKWPNDIYLNQQKLAGILIETKYREKDIYYVVIGIGVNATKIDRNVLFANIIIEMDNILDCDFLIVKNEWLAHCMHLNRSVSLYFSHMDVNTGVHTGISNNGELILDSNEKNTYTSSLSLIIN